VSEQIWAIAAFMEDCILCVKKKLEINHVSPCTSSSPQIKRHQSRACYTKITSPYSKTSNREVLMSLTRGTLKVFLFQHGRNHTVNEESF